MRYKCRRCGAAFERARLHAVYEDVDGRRLCAGGDPVCPACGEDDFERAAQCRFCRDWFFAGDRVPQWDAAGHAVDYCPVCRRRAERSLLAFARQSICADYLTPRREGRLYDAEIRKMPVLGLQRRGLHPRGMRLRAF